MRCVFDSQKHASRGIENGSQTRRMPTPDRGLTLRTLDFNDLDNGQSVALACDNLSRSAAAWEAAAAVGNAPKPE